MTKFFLLTMMFLGVALMVGAAWVLPPHVTVRSATYDDWTVIGLFVWGALLMALSGIALIDAPRR